MGNNLTLADAVVSANTGLDAIKRAPIVEENTGIKCLRIQDVNQKKDFTNWGYSLVEEKNFEKFQLRTNDILIARTGGSVGSNRYINKDLQSVFNNGLIRIRVDTAKHNPKFIYYLLQTEAFKSHIGAIAYSTSAQPNMKIRDFLRFEFLDLGLCIENSIEKILTCLDDKIELNRQTNQTLEKMAQALFKSWFVDFDPVIDNALAAGTNISDFPEPLQKRAELRKAAQQSTDAKKLPEDIRKLFPSEFEESELGWVPKGWEVCSFESMINLIGGGTPKTTVDEYWNGEIPWFSVVDAPNNCDIFVIDTEKHITQLGVDKSSTKILRVGTTIISARGTVGKCAMVATPMAMNQSCYGVVGKNDISDEYIYFQTRYQVSNLQKRSHGSIFSTITRDTFKSISIAFCGDEITQIFKKLTESKFDKVLLNNKQNTKLSRLRGVLLPKLISGELDMSSISKLENIT